MNERDGEQESLGASGASGTPASNDHSATIDPLLPLRVALRGRYEIQKEIGQGAFATVFLARDCRHERQVALKVLNADPSSDAGEIRFIREIRISRASSIPTFCPSTTRATSRPSFIT